MAITKLPENPTKSAATMGKEYLLYINTGTVEVPKWTVVGGQRSTSLKRTADEIDASDKTTKGWKSSLAGLRSWSMEASAIVILSDEGREALDYAYENGVQVHCKFEFPDKVNYTGWGSIADYSLETPHDDVATCSLTINGVGPLTKATT